MSNELEDFIRSNQEAFDTKMPDPAVLRRLQEQLNAPAKKKGILVSFKMMRWAAACVLVLIGSGIFWLFHQKEIATPQTASLKQEPFKTAISNPANTTNGDAASNTANNTAALEANRAALEQQQINNKRQAIFASLKDMQSPGNRMTAASEAMLLKGADKEIIDALVRTMNNDPNTNVRLAALDALNRFRRETYVKQQLVRSLKKQNDPMVQIQLIQLLTQMRETAILKELEKMVQDDNTMDAVKDNAYSSMITLKS